MKLARIMVAGIAVVGLAACSAVIVEEPIGTEIVRIDADEWEGTWVAADGDSLTVTVGDAEAGELWISRIVDDEGEPTVRSLVAYVRDAEPLGSGQVLLSVEDDGRYAWALVVRDEEYAVLYAPDIDRFRTLVEEGKLPGTVSDGSEWRDGNVYLGRLEPEHLQVIFGREDGGLFEWEAPQVLRRVAH